MTASRTTVAAAGRAAVAADKAAASVCLAAGDVVAAATSLVSLLLDEFDSWLGNELPFFCYPVLPPLPPSLSVVSKPT